MCVYSFLRNFRQKAETLIKSKAWSTAGWWDVTQAWSVPAIVQEHYFVITKLLPGQCKSTHLEKNRLI